MVSGRQFSDQINSSDAPRLNSLRVQLPRTSGGRADLPELLDPLSYLLVGLRDGVMLGRLEARLRADVNVITYAQRACNFIIGCSSIPFFSQMVFETPLSLLAVRRKTSS